ncbi:hypothetical protein EVG20_g5832 [Dentipellis fragilis]|uniref:Uncharacterized protein n=1 Tax=Dentipellis fragilis TaxID=205917 RepID=A0A4Y9YSV2_9AGAM|nr:hypothetical protein EVG20_g5832 [Dentipellis fragilis]
MSFKKSKLDLLVRVRYQNPLPPPPCPPKLIDIPTNPQRYAQPEFLDSVTNEMPLPMIVDAECGMPLDLGKWECLWQENADDRALNPDPKDLPVLDPKDQALLLDPSSSAFHSSSDLSRTSTPLPAHVPWLRKTEYISRENQSAAHRQAQRDQKKDNDVSISRESQLKSVEASFKAANDPPLADLRHPTKPHLTAVETYDILPDADIWANAYDLFRFSERPGERPPDVDDPRLDCAVMRPMEADGDHFLAYYLTKDDEAALRFKETRSQTGIDDVLNEDEGTDFLFQRDYEVVKVEQDVPNEFLLVFDEGDVSQRPKGAYYKDIERKMLLKKKRTEPIERFRDKWALVRVSHVPPASDEAEERADALAEVTDPMYLLGRDAEGEEDTEAAGGAQKIEVDA